MNHRLIVNADDYGRTPAVSAGIRSAHQNGIVSSTTAMMNFFSIEEDLRKAMQECPELGIGVHLVLTSGKPVLPPEQIATLILGDGRFPNLAEFMVCHPTARLSEVELEWRAQIEKFISITGRRPTHLDSHHHSSYFTPKLFELMLNLAKEYQCAIRNAYFQLPEGALTGLPVELVSPVLADMHQLYADYRPRTTSRFISSFYDDNATSEELMRIFRTLPEGPAEMMCHPGYVDEILVEGSIYCGQREDEVAVLTASKLEDRLAEFGIELITYTDL